METLTLEEIRTLQLALINMEDGLLAQGIVKMKYLHEKLERMAKSLPTLRAVDPPSALVGDYSSDNSAGN